jgi:hypothetical protein
VLISRWRQAERRAPGEISPTFTRPAAIYRKLTYHLIHLDSSRHQD